jgi:hypothetical protein
MVTVRVNQLLSYGNLSQTPVARRPPDQLVDNQDRSILSRRCCVSTLGSAPVIEL